VVGGNVAAGRTGEEVEVDLRTVGVLGSTEVMMPFMPVLCSTLGLCWMASWLRGEMGECWWEWEWEAGRLPLPPPPPPPPPPLLCSVPGLQMGACSTVAVDVRMDFSRSRSRSRSLSDAEVAEGFVK